MKDGAFIFSFLCLMTVIVTFDHWRPNQSPAPSPAATIQAFEQLQFEEELTSDDDPFYNPCLSPRQREFIKQHSLKP